MALINLVMNVIIIKILLPIAKFHPCTPQIRRRRQTNKSLHQIHFIFINYVESINYFCDDETACDAYTFNSSDRVMLEHTKVQIGHQMKKIN